ncbi:uncharacterized protein KNAG_0L01610 [Huiozyma naganishii CBS 8797]|uniref:Transmembrane protein n=1 Tax=Huiozyma naganishii (strain ATCC MYA-139 / BCRC 22969 / CBS 8797 / KCTC 17520 / NBRC 10181 / NCYC 3082 / Yp74L-3) TaxID=1071383 RepID=J7SB64_HUIN7|nr:hypothetical protein KNAG_0L01610 [Kazachstania naganishii CBS 8797]CCK72781.1 hypothetical protein KNAG_0L01610 [Kazachstania naganishii CBS 8797]
MHNSTCNPPTSSFRVYYRPRTCPVRETRRVNRTGTQTAQHTKTRRVKPCLFSETAQRRVSSLSFLFSSRFRSRDAVSPASNVYTGEGRTQRQSKRKQFCCQNHETWEHKDRCNSGEKEEEEEEVTRLRCKFLFFFLLITNHVLLGNYSVRLHFFPIPLFALRLRLLAVSAFRYIKIRFFPEL